MGSGWDRRGPREVFSNADKRFILRRDEHTCYQCGGPGTEADHVVPIAEGGRNDPSNGRAICPPCHETKTKEEIRRGLARRRAKMKLPEDPHPFYGRRNG